MSNQTLKDLVGKTDIYLLDLILSGAIPEDGPVLDAGCGGGRNLRYFAKTGREIYATDKKPEAIDSARAAFESFGGDVREDHFLVCQLQDTGFEAGMFSLVICNAVLHFAKTEAHFSEMVDEMWRVLRPGGILFARLATDIGIESLVKKTDDLPGSRWHLLPDGSNRFLVNESFLMSETKRLNGELVGPLKTVHVQNLRCMSNWVLRKPQ